MKRFEKFHGRLNGRLIGVTTKPVTSGRSTNFNCKTRRSGASHSNVKFVDEALRIDPLETCPASIPPSSGRNSGGAGVRWGGMRNDFAEVERTGLPRNERLNIHVPAQVAAVAATPQCHPFVNSIKFSNERFQRKPIPFKNSLAVKCQN
jgi:hypothetical protein